MIIHSKVKILLIFFILSWNCGYSQAKEDTFCAKIRLFSKKEYLDCEWITSKLTSKEIMSLTGLSSKKPLIYSFKSIVHEGYHMKYGYLADIKGKYYIDKFTMFDTGLKESFSANKIDEIIPDSIKNKLKNYNLYIKADTTMAKAINNHFLPTKDSVTIISHGLISLLEELTAYYQNIVVYNRTYNYLKQQRLFTNDSIALNFLIESETVANLSYIEYYILKYIEYSRQYYPDLYNIYTHNQNLILLFNYIHKQNLITIDNYNKYKEDILKINPKLKNVDNPLQIRDPFNEYFNWVLPDKEILYGKNLLQKELENKFWLKMQ